MQRSLIVGVGSALSLTFVASGCGGSSPTPAPSIPFKSAAIVRSAIPARYTCDGKNIAPPLEWGAVPSGTKELAVFLLALTPNPATGRFRFSIDWAVAGIDPSLHRLPAGDLPRGASVGLTSSGKLRYSLCPPRGSHARYQFALYAVAPSVNVPGRFSGPELLQALAEVRSNTPASGGGEFTAFYTRPKARKHSRRNG